MSKNSINSNNKNINKNNFYRNKRLFNIDDIDFNKILISQKEPYGKKMVGYVKCFDGNKTMFFKVTDKKLLKNILKYGKGSAA